MDYASLRQQGILELERLSGGQWTDFNAHDPGITLLEQLCYVLTDLGYRAGHDIPDLLAGEGRDPHGDLHPPAEILSSRPVTTADLRRVVLDVQGVKNAWVEPLEQDTPGLYVHPGNAPETYVLTLTPEPLPSERVKLKGLHRVLIEAEDGEGGNAVTARVARRLHRNRGLCEDFAEIKALSPEMIQVRVTVEIGPAQDALRLGPAIVQAIADAISPPVPVKNLEDLRGAGIPLDTIFEGPRLEHGFIPAEVLEDPKRPVAINTSDLVRAIKDVAGVRAVSTIRVRTGAEPDWQDWSLRLNPERVARLDRMGSTITLQRDGKVVAEVKGEEATPAPSRPRIGSEAALALPVGRDRHVDKYSSVQRHLPAIYGVGEVGLPASATPERRAAAAQLEAYLTFFDQLMANERAQLAHAGDLFSYNGQETRTYFAQTAALPDSRLGAIRAPDPSPTPAADSERRSRFLNHLLARFAETLDDHETSTGADLLRRKQELLRDYPRLGGARGTAVSSLAPAGGSERSALEDRIRLQLGLAPDELFFVVEHILLRPMEGDDEQPFPLLSAALHKDPYSLQLTFVFRCGAGRFPAGEHEQTAFRGFVEQAIREETPAHLTAYVRWMSEGDWQDCREAHEEWMEKRRAYLTDKLGLSPEGGE